MQTILHPIKRIACCAASQYSAVNQDFNNSFIMLKEKSILIKHLHDLEKPKNTWKRELHLPDHRVVVHLVYTMKHLHQVHQLLQYVIQSPSLQEKIATAEILWALKVAQRLYSYSSCDATPALFKRMFSGDVAEHFSMSKSKVSYLLSDGLGPHYRREMCASICETKSVFTLQYDETANTQNRKQCDLLLRYWSETAGEIRVQFLKALMFGHAKGKDVSIAILDTLQEEGCQLPLAQLISLGSDGPNLNKTIWNLINEHMKASGLHGILLFIPCNLHIVHNPFRQCLNVFGEQAEQLVLDLLLFLKASPCRKEDFFETQLGLGLEWNVYQTCPKSLAYAYSHG